MSHRCPIGSCTSDRGASVESFGPGLWNRDSRYIVTLEHAIYRDTHIGEGDLMAQEKWLVDGPKTIDIEHIRSLKVGLIGGHIDIVGHDEPGTRIEVHSVDGRPLKITIDGDRLEIDHPQINWENWLDVFSNFSGKARAEISVSVPREVALKFGVVNATALIAGITGDATVSTVNGDLQLDGVAGDVTLNSVNAELSVHDHRGGLTVHTVTGDITAQGELTGFSSDGVSGAVYLDATGHPSKVRVNTVSGSVTARFDDDAATSYRINTVAGKLLLDSASISGVRGLYTGKYGELERHYVEFSANTVSGDISVLHAVRA